MSFLTQKSHAVLSLELSKHPQGNLFPADDFKFSLVQANSEHCGWCRLAARCSQCKTSDESQGHALRVVGILERLVSSPSPFRRDPAGHIVTILEAVAVLIVIGIPMLSPL
eukprot:c10482_g1_i1 orf=285-617(-)